MNKYRYTITLQVEVDAFDSHDADEIIEDAFGLGDNCGANVVETEVEFLGPVDNR